MQLFLMMFFILLQILNLLAFIYLYSKFSLFVAIVFCLFYFVISSILVGWLVGRHAIIKGPSKKK